MLTQLSDRPNTTGSFFIRPLTVSDVSGLLKFYQTLAPAVKKFYQPFGPEVKEDAVVNHLRETDAGQNISLGLIGPDGGIAGHSFVAAINTLKPTFGIGLQERVHGLGMGKKMMAMVMEECDQKKLPLVCLSVVKANTRAKTMYEKIGFVLTGETTFKEKNDSYLMERVSASRLVSAGEGKPTFMLDSFLKLLRGEKPDRVVWTADITYWIAGQKQAGTAAADWDTEEGYLRFNRKLGIMPYYSYSKFWTGTPQYGKKVKVSSKTDGDRTLNRIQTPVGELTEESIYLRESCSTGCAKHYVKSEDDLDVLHYLIEHRRLVPANLADYQQRMKLWREYDGLPGIGLPRSPLAAFCCEWAGVEELAYLLMDCKEKITGLFQLMAEQEALILDAICEVAPPLVHFPDNLSSANLAGLYDEYMADGHRRRIERLHKAGIRCAVHLDGTVRGLLPKLVNVGFDAIEALTTKPAGDLDAGEMNDLAGGDRVILWGGVPGVMFAPPYTWKDMETHVKGVIECWKDRPFVLGVADQVPPDGNIDFCRRIADMLE